MNRFVAAARWRCRTDARIQAQMADEERNRRREKEISFLLSYSLLIHDGLISKDICSPAGEQTGRGL